ncbi:MAG: helix-turn-helix transcriptional regulator [Nitrospirae bacterium]|nr:helix-turn-helix transcriptional regulator [Magnetococcales bacterium]
MSETKTTRTFQHLFEEAERDSLYWKEGLILEFTSDLYQLMKAQGFTKKDLADRLGTSKAYVTKIFQGDANFTAESMTRIAHALNGRVKIHVTRRDDNSRFCDVSDKDCAYRKTTQIVKNSNIHRFHKPVLPQSEHPLDTEDRAA